MVEAIGAVQQLGDDYLNVNVTGSMTAGVISGLNVNVGSITSSFTQFDGGTGILSSGSRWVSYNETFTAAPYVNATGIISGDAGDVDSPNVIIGTNTTGSFYATGSPNSGSFVWTAQGTSV